MKYPTILNKLWLLSVFFSIIPIQAAQTKISDALIVTINNNAQSWSLQCASLAPSSLEILANFLYLSYRHAYLDAQASKALIELKTMLPSLRTNMRNPDNPISMTGTYMRTSKRFFAYNGLRYHISKCWNHCVQHLESLEDPVLQNVYEAMQHDGQQSISNYLHTNTTVPVTLKQLQHHMKHARQQLYTINFRIEAFFEKMVATTQPDDTIIIDTDHALAINNHIQNIADYLYTPCIALDEHQMNLIFVSAHFFYQYYSAMYHYLPADYHRMLFGPQGMFTEHFLQLPSPIASTSCA